MDNVIDGDIIIREFKNQLHNYVQFQTNTLWERHEPSNPLTYGLNSTTSAFLQ